MIRSYETKEKQEGYSDLIILECEMSLSCILPFAIIVLLGFAYICLNLDRETQRKALKRKRQHLKKTIKRSGFNFTLLHKSSFVPAVTASVTRVGKVYTTTLTTEKVEVAVLTGNFTDFYAHYSSRAKAGYIVETPVAECSALN
jgi:hypothetical protein